MTDLLLVRHARPVRHDAAPGAEPDPDLGDIGRAQAAALAGWLAAEPIDALWSSPMLRARRTAEPLAAATGLDVRLLDELREITVGERSYIPVEEMTAADSALTDAWAAAIAGGDANPVVRAFRERVMAGLDVIATAHPDQRVAVTCHGGVVNAALTAVLGISELAIVPIRYTAVTRLRFRPSGDRTVLTVNETAHLQVESRRVTCPVP